MWLANITGQRHKPKIPSTIGEDESESDSESDSDEEDEDMETNTNQESQSKVPLLQVGFAPL